MNDHPNRPKKPRRRGDVAAAITAYVQEHPHAQYFEMLEDLHSRGYKVNRHGSYELMQLFKAARQAAQEKSER